MLNTRLKDLPAGDLNGLLEELELLKGVPVAGHADVTLLGYLDLCQRDLVRDKREGIQAARFFAGSLLKTKIQKLSNGDTERLVRQLCSHFKVPHEVIINKALYVFLNEILNPRSRMRATQRIRI